MERCGATLSGMESVKRDPVCWQDISWESILSTRGTHLKKYLVERLVTVVFLAQSPHGNP